MVLLNWKYFNQTIPGCSKFKLSNNSKCIPKVWFSKFKSLYSLHYKPHDKAHILLMNDALMPSCRPPLAWVFVLCPLFLARTPPAGYSTLAVLLTTTVGLYHGGTYSSKSLARPRRKQAAVTKLGIYSTYYTRSSVHFLAHCSNFWKPRKKNSECCPSNQVYVAAMTSVSYEKWWPFNCSFSPGNRLQSNGAISGE